MNKGIGGLVLFIILGLTLSCGSREVTPGSIWNLGGGNNQDSLGSGGEDPQLVFMARSVRETVTSITGENKQIQVQVGESLSYKWVAPQGYNLTSFWEASPSNSCSTPEGIWRSNMSNEQVLDPEVIDSCLGGKTVTLTISASAPGVAPLVSQITVIIYP